ncbi:MAG TPA: AAA family ATPase [Oligoflexus sp.]|uniref:bifunctional aminoglycoside phosphotransferase/ATP-binding protein n=1 Tax=Oligoflexus sp. TaxID=1971216 RepID=UPI002D7F6E49|nr:AAA family ATPase [Oligoflexus sp.]HET9238362.1 AAA family ATPase [Oligoflexus sp.]
MSLHEKLEAFLQQPASYPEATARVELRETHISKVFLTDHAAFKIKKPLKLPFLDYSNLERRRDACFAELELNRRFSHDIYRDVVAITVDEKGFTWNGRGPTLEYAVWMRRIPDACLMDVRLRERTFQKEDSERLIAHLVHCYQEAPHGARDGELYWQRLRALIDENRSSLYELALHLKLDPEPWLALCSRQLLFMQVNRRLMITRAEDGFVIEGHGDLRPEHIVFEDRVSLIDGIEFNRDLRVLDQADELSFLAMECAVMGYSEPGHEIRHRVLQDLNDPAPPELLAFYESYRATVRAKVNALRAEQETGEKQKRTLALIADYQNIAENALKKAMPPVAFIVAGAMGSGKTTLARSLKQELGAVHWESDEIRRKVFGKSQGATAYGQGHYTPAARLCVYESLRDHMMISLAAGMNVIVDASFSHPDFVRTMLEPLLKDNRPYVILVCECSDDEAMARIRKRMHEGDSPSEARPDLYLEQKRKGDWTFATFPHWRVNTEHDQQEEMRKVFDYTGRVLRQGFEV